MVIKVTDLVERIKARQGDMTDTAFVKLLEEKGGIRISRPTWHMVRTGKREPSIDVLRAIARTFPDMTRDILNYIFEGQDTNHD